VLSFALYEPGEPPVGDVYIGLEQALRQAEEAGIDPREEVARLAVHGSLHVLGHDHPKGVGRTRSAMWIMQEQIVGRVMNATDVRTSTSTRTGTRTNAPGTAAGRQSLS
jgi:probable rRNA maturation factor